MRTLLTGATGFVGAHLLRALLDDGQEVTALVRAPGRLGPLAAHPRLRERVAPLDDAGAVAAAVPGHDRVVHAALLWGPPGTEPEDVAAAERLFDAAGRAGVRRCVLVSSAAVHRPFRPVMDEDDALVPTEPYGVTKAGGERALWAARAAHGVEAVVVRPGPVVGPPAFAGGPLRVDGRVAAMVEAARAGRPIEVVAGDGRQLVDVAVVARLITRLTRVPAPQAVYLCMDRSVLPWEEVARRVVAALGSASPVVVTPGEGAPPRFRTGRMERLLGEVGDAREALERLLGGMRDGG